MPESQSQIFDNISPAQFDTLIAKARDAGIDISGESGSATKFGIAIAWNYSPQSRQLTLQCLSTPFFVTPDEVNRKIRALVAQSLT